MSQRYSDNKYFLKKRYVNIPELLKLAKYKERSKSTGPSTPR